MNGQPLISIVIPCYNQAKFLPFSLDSVLNQSFDNWECIVINDGATDNTEEIALQFCEKDSRIRYIKKKNGGLSSARNEGINNSSGRYLQFLDADDLLEKEKLHTALDAYNNLSDRSNLIIYSSCRYFQDATPSTISILGRRGFIGHIELKYFDALETQNQAIKQRNFCVISAPLYPRVVFETIGLYDPALHAFEDWDVNLRCSNHGFLFHHESFRDGNTRIRLHDNSMMSSNDHMKRNLLKFNEKHQLRKIPVGSNRKIDGIKRVLKSFIPPIFLKLLK